MELFSTADPSWAFLSKPSEFINTQRSSNAYRVKFPLVEVRHRDLRVPETSLGHNNSGQKSENGIDDRMNEWMII